jgi:two-component system nitrogen regulation response regulator GlnG/two-component system response regulator HydG
MKETLTVSIGTGLGLAPADPTRTVTAFVLLWSRDEPERVGEVALVPGGHPGVAVLFGRAEASPDDALPRAEWIRQRPGRVAPTGALRSPRISRDQLRIEAVGGDQLKVVNVGRCPLLHNGQQVNECAVAPGDLLELRGQVLMLCTNRPLSLPAFAPVSTPPPLHPFGEADPHGIVGESAAAWELRERIHFVAPRTAHVLIRGPSGTGKELVAQAIHAISTRGRRPLISRNAATFPETLIDAELFGNAKNYPNPGMPERPGLIGDADGSTLFLDEFGELPSGMQAHLLRVLDSGEYQRLGESRPRRADFRLIAATNRPDGYLKEDVLARLRIRVEVPDLNERREDIPLVVRHVLRRIARNDPELARRYFPDGDYTRDPRISPALIGALVQRRYTTHVRELEGLLWQAMSEGRGDYLDVFEGFPAPEAPAASPPSGPAPTGSGIDPLSIPVEVIQECLARHEGRQEPVWRELGLSSRHVLTRLVRKYNLTVRGRTPGGSDEDSAGD